MKRLLPLLAVALLAAAPLFAAETETLAERTLKNIVGRQRDLLADAAKAGDKLDESSFRTQAQTLAHEFEALLRDNPKYAAGHAAYGYFLGKVGQRRESLKPWASRLGSESIMTLPASASRADRWRAALCVWGCGP